ncbi:hypothetical protein [Numidum massiliense]|uniref:hypothetical protein n=1 Tax=Numidum massiliense TaxID=1522315 RepID=UPI0006D5A41F|nr:hypothetical protein [Numidum massiliense]
MVAQMSQSLSVATEMAAKLETPLGEQLLLVIDNAFLEGMSAALLTCVGVIAIGIVLTALFLPSRAERVAKKADQTEVSS